MPGNRDRLAACLAGALMLAMPLTAAAGDETQLPLLSLQEAMEAALAHHPGPAAATAQVAAMQTKGEQVSAWHDPGISLMTGIPFTTPGDPPLVEVKVSQTFPLSPILSHKKKEAEALATATSTMVPASELDVRLAVARVYYELVFLQELRDVTLKQRDVAEGIVEAATLRYASLAGNQADVLRAKISLDQVETTVEVLDLGIASAREVLVLLMGDDTQPDDFSVQTPAESLPHLAEDELVELALENRPELGYFDAKAVALEAKKKVAKNASAPWLTVTAGYQYKSDTLVGLMGQDAFVLGVGLNIPVSQIKKNKAAADEADALLLYNAAQKDELALHIAKQVVIQIKNLEALGKKIELQENKVIPEAGVALELTLSAYTVQKASITDVLSAFEKLLDARYQRSALRGEFFASFADLQRIVGTFEVPVH